MDELLFLAHRIPYPPNKGDKIRSFNLLNHLARRFRIHLGAFVDDPHDLAYRDEVGRYCAGLHLARLPRSVKVARGLAALARGEAATVSVYRDRGMARWVQRTLAGGTVRRALVYSGAMASYLLGPGHDRLRRVIDFVDVDSDKWAQYARGQGGRPSAWVWRREASLLRRFERAVASRFDASVFVSAAEAGLFRGIAPEAAGRVACVENGVDTGYFDPRLVEDDPYPAGARAIAFTGAMDYWANVDAVRWFCGDVLPAVRRAVPAAVCYIVGARPAAAVLELRRHPGVVVTGGVRDIRPYLARASVVVAPMRIARGVQNKVLEAMAMARPVVATEVAMDGLRLAPPLQRLVAGTPAGFASKVVGVLRDGDRDGLGGLGRQWVLSHYAWRHNLERMERLLLPELAAPASNPAMGVEAGPASSTAAPACGGVPAGPRVVERRT